MIPDSSLLKICEQRLSAYMDMYRRVQAERDILLGAVTMTPELQSRLNKISTP